MTNSQTIRIFSVIFVSLFVTTLFVELTECTRVIYINARTAREQEVATGNMISAPNTCGIFERLDARNRCRRVCLH